jgi:hypothetical protein
VRTVSYADLKEAAESFAIRSHAHSRIAAIGVGNGWRREGSTDGKRYSAVATTANPGTGAAARHLGAQAENSPNSNINSDAWSHTRGVTDLGATPASAASMLMPMLGTTLNMGVSYLRPAPSTATMAARTALSSANRRKPLSATLKHPPNRAMTVPRICGRLPSMKS